MKKGKVGPSLRLLQENNSGGILPLTHTTKTALKEKHLPAKVAAPDTKIEGPQQDGLEGIFEEMNGLMIWKMALKTQGASGPSGLNADCVRTLLSKRIFGEVAVDLRKALASLAKKMAMKECKDIEALIARRLIPLDKNPGVRPIAIGEVFTRILGKCIMAVTREDVKLAAGNLQVCVGHQAGGEATTHAMQEIFKDKEVEAAILVDATNTFNSINREAMLLNIAVKCPEINRYVQNCYGKPSKLFIVDGKQNSDRYILYSEEGTTQGDPVAMAMYALGLSVGA